MCCARAGESGGSRWTDRKLRSTYLSSVFCHFFLPVIEHSPSIEIMTRSLHDHTNIVLARPPQRRRDLAFSRSIDNIGRQSTELTTMSIRLRQRNTRVVREDPSTDRLRLGRVEDARSPIALHSLTRVGGVEAGTIIAGRSYRRRCDQDSAEGVVQTHPLRIAWPRAIDRVRLTSGLARMAKSKRSERKQSNQ